MLKAGGATPVTTDDCPVVEKGDSLVGFSEEEDSADYATPRTWRVTGNLRWEKNTLWADRDVFFGPAVVLGFQTDPGLAAPDFFPILLFGGSLTQVEIDPEYFEERLQGNGLVLSTPKSLSTFAAVLSPLLAQVPAAALLDLLK